MTIKRFSRAKDYRKGVISSRRSTPRRGNRVAAAESILGETVCRAMKTRNSEGRGERGRATSVALLRRLRRRTSDVENCGGRSCELTATTAAATSRCSTPSAIIRVIADNLFRGNRGECAAHGGPVAGNLVNIHVRIKPLAPVSGPTDRKEDGEERGNARLSRRMRKRGCEVDGGKTSRRTCGLVQLFSLCYVTSAVTGFSGSALAWKGHVPFFAFVIQE